MLHSVNIDRHRAVIQITACMLVGGLVGWGLHHLTYKPPETFVDISITFPEGTSSKQAEQIYREAKENADRLVGVQHSPHYQLVLAIASIGFFSIFGGMIGTFGFLVRAPKPT